MGSMMANREWRVGYIEWVDSRLSYPSRRFIMKRSSREPAWNRYRSPCPKTLNPPLHLPAVAVCVCGCWHPWRLILWCQVKLWNFSRNAGRSIFGNDRLNGAAARGADWPQPCRLPKMVLRFSFQVAMQGAGLESCGSLLAYGLSATNPPPWVEFHHMPETASPLSP